MATIPLPAQPYRGPVLIDPGSDMPKLPSQLDVLAARQTDDVPSSQRMPEGWGALLWAIGALIGAPVLYLLVGSVL